MADGKDVSVRGELKNVTAHVATGLALTIFASFLLGPVGGLIVGGTYVSGSLGDQKK